MTKPSQKVSHLESAKRTIAIELEAIQSLSTSLDDSFHSACELILNTKGRTIVTGMGKSGHIGNKLAATLASTGTPAFYVHPGEAAHGDMGMITREDVVIALSNSGTTGEITTLLPLLKRMGVPLIAITGNAESIMAQSAEVHLSVAVGKEACPLNLAPTSSTTASLVMGDALAIALLEARGFTAEEFAFSHPGGALGRRLLLMVQDVMHTGNNIPKINTGAKLTDALIEMGQKALGMTTVMDGEKLAGVFTDGDLRRAIDQGIDLQSSLIEQVMTTSCKTVAPNMLAAEALHIMEENKITTLVVKDKDQLLGVLHMHELLKKL